MICIYDSTAIIHTNTHYKKMSEIVTANSIKKGVITRINYLEILAGAPENSKLDIKKYLQQFTIIELDVKAIQVANKLATQIRISKKNQRDFLIAAIAIANKLPILTENNKDFVYPNLKVLGYRIKEKSIQ